MAQRLTPSQFRSRLQQLENQRRQAINRYNQSVRQHVQKINGAIDSYNRKVRDHNARVRADRQRVLQAFSRFQSRRTTVSTYVRFRSSVETLHRAYLTLERAAESYEPSDAEVRLLDLSERENANSLDVMNALQSEGDRPAVVDDLSRLRETHVDSYLRAMSVDLADRWKGALFSLHPENPDAARHFCTSAREIFTAALEQRAPDDEVKRTIPNCPVGENGRPTRRARIRYALVKKGVANAALEDFVDEDVDNIVELFGVFNDGTHGSVGRFAFEQLVAIKHRVEHGIEFLHQVFI